MKHLVILSVVVVGCFAAAQLNAERTRYRPVNPFRYDSFPSAARVSGNIAKAAVPPTLLNDHQIRLMLDAHIVCLSELKGAKGRLDDINLSIDQFKMEVREDILNINTQLAALVANLDLEHIKLQMNVNSQLLADTLLNIQGLEAKLDVTNQNTLELTHYQNEMNVTVEKLKEEQRETAENVTVAKYEIEYLNTDMEGVKQQSRDTYNYVEELKTGWLKTDLAVADVIGELSDVKEEALKSNVQIAELQARTSPSSIGEMPESCGDLRRLGHVKSGIHLVMGEKGVESIYCDFTSEGMDHWIGYTDVKTTPVYFSVQRTSRFNTTNVPIPFDLAKSSIGGAMNLTTGISM
ncbi:C1q and tumor necrosis factor-related protein 2 [Daphnia sinensis]|uniref:C1q and tumor necrosis factor-related protein 2 n=1 Tax=Daphnia sinensis TaxID=1820382 RepID=A0AAD5Q0V4_9CRUS|nr:C1q and tumor necrosis factor-related protein 2 [Daphnia sinensis]